MPRSTVARIADRQSLKDAAAVPWAVVGILLVGLGLRWPVPEPQWVQVDERSFVEFTLGFFSGDLNPHFFNYSTLHFYLCAALDGLWFLPEASLPTSVAWRYFVDGFDLIVIARAVGSLMSTATIVVAWRLGRRLYGPAAGVGAAALLACTPLAVRFAHLAATDSPAVLWSTLAVLFAVRIVQENRARDCLWAGVFAGLAAATKYPAGLVAVPVAAAVLLQAGPGRLRGLLRAAAAAMLTFAVASPYTWLDPGAFWAGLSQMGSEHLVGDMHAGGQHRAWPVLQVNLRYGLGLAGLLAGGLALVCPWRWRRDELPLLLAILAFGALVLGASSLFMRYCLPLAPLWAVLLWRLLHRLDGRLGLQLACTGLLLAEPAHASWKQRRLLGGPDTRTEFSRWLRERQPQGGRLVQMQGRPGQPRRLFSPILVLLRLQPFERAFGLPRLVDALDELARRDDLPPLYTFFDLRALPGVVARPGQAALDSALVLYVTHPLRQADDEGTLLQVADRLEWRATFSPGAMPDAVFDAVDWMFVPVAGWRDVEATGPTIRVGSVPLAFHRPVPTSAQFLRLVHDLQAGRLAARRQEWPAARQFLRNVVDGPWFLEELLTPALRYEAWLKLGAADYALGSLDDAVAAWRQAATLGPQQWEPHYNLGLAYDALGRRDLAAAHYAVAAQRQPAHADAQLGLARALVHLGLAGEASNAFAAALAAHPTMASYLALEQTLRQTGRPAAADSLLREALRQFPEDPRSASIRQRLQE